MFRRFAGPALCAIALAISGAASAGDFSKATYIAVGRQTLVPYGWADFCNRYQGECNGKPLAAMDLALTPKTQKILEKINAQVNAQIKSVADADHWGVVDQWDYPSDGKGDCEDFVLFKRRLLMEEGFPRQALLVTVVKDEQGDGHAVLTVKTDKGEYVLDNLHNEIRPWSKTPYKYVKRQSQTDPNVWIEIGEPPAQRMVAR